jgi:hypothetical protein
VEAVGIEEQFSLLWRLVRLWLVEQLHDACSDGHGNAHDDALAHPVDGVLLAVVRRVKLKAF